jgi:hypothetical protein
MFSQIGRLTVLVMLMALVGWGTGLRAQDPEVAEETPTAPATAKATDSASITLHVTDVPGVWEALRGTALRKAIEGVFALPMVADDESLATLKVGIARVAERTGTEPTMDGMLGQNTKSARLILFDAEEEAAIEMPFVMELEMATPELAQALGEVLQANLGAEGMLVVAANSFITLTNEPSRMMQDRMADWRAPRVQMAFEGAPLEGAQVRFFAQPGRDEEVGAKEKISAGFIRFQPDRIDLAMRSVPALPDGALRQPTGEGLRDLDQWVTLSETPHVFSLAYFGAASLLAEAAAGNDSSRGRMVATALERYTGFGTAEMLEALGEEATFALNSLGVRGMFDFSVGFTGAWEVKNPEKAKEMLAAFRVHHEAALRKDSESYRRTGNGLTFSEEEYRGLTILSAPLMIFPIQPSDPPSLNLVLTDKVLFVASSLPAMKGLVDRSQDGTGAGGMVERARAGHAMPEGVHSLGTMDFVAFADVFRRALPVIVALTKGGQESQVLGGAFAEVIGSLGQGVATGIYEPTGESVRASVLLAGPNP